MLASACAHPIHKEFDVYLKEHPSSLEKVNKEASYRIDEDTRKMSYEFRSATTGVANLWVVNVGEMLQDYVNVALTNSFQRLIAESGATVLPLNFYFKISSYRFEDFRAKVAMDITVSQDGSVIIEKRYSAEGQGQAGKMFWGGAFAQRHAVHQSTHLAFQEIFTQFIADLKKNIRE
jgi:malate/lactate dehydrogenase